ncbi:toll/interleukin-1 receptor domain-containing protein [Burkholderia sp. USMB20]|uniref:toll/interleukin-1 receptor domain-containing protein n=1 Tax=Burkholderia sp. USMB20 TaxID=1571773 RepID=UPI001A9B4B78|nr:toll/interleukin-1 receptor domain-containing protein [Burkholderia sp. USMB20]
MKLTINGKSIMPRDLEKEIMRTAAAKIATSMREKLGSIRHPETGEFPSVVVEGDDLRDMAFRIEGSPALLQIVRDRMSPEELNSMTFVDSDAGTGPRAFLSYGWEDRHLASKIAECLQANGIETWWAEWEIRAGDSIRRKIDEGLENCTHFLVLLTPASITRPWVNEEIDGGFIRKLGDKSRFIPLRHGLGATALPPLMAGMLSPEIGADGTGMLQLVHDIHGVSRKPERGPAPAAVSAPRSGYTSAATAVAGLFVTASKNGQFADPQLKIDEIAERTGLSPEDLADALYEIRHRVQTRFDFVVPKSTLYSEFDRYWQPWDPALDAVRLAVDLVNDSEMPTTPLEIAQRYGWTARRLNPAIAYLQERDAIRVFQALASGPFITLQVSKTDATRRFVKSRS